MTNSLEKVYQGDCSVHTHYSVGGSAAITLASGRPWAVRLFETGISAHNQIQRVQWRYFAPLRARPEGDPTWSRVQRTPQQVGFKRTEPDFNDSSSCPKRRCSRAITTAAVSCGVATQTVDECRIVLALGKSLWWLGPTGIEILHTRHPNHFECYRD
jgi:hypothetical protein